MNRWKRVPAAAAAGPLILSIWLFEVDGVFRDLERV